ncbi:MAG TPA: hypothetical protein VF472_04225 [Burkholderiaceae bacterium]
MIDCAAAMKPAAANMGTAEHEPGAWHLLSLGEDFYLYVRTGLHGYAFWLLVKLDAREAAGYRAGGAVFLQDLVRRIVRNPYSYFARNAWIDMQKAVFDALTAWHNGPGRLQAANV